MGRDAEHIAARRLGVALIGALIAEFAQLAVGGGEVCPVRKYPPVTAGDHLNQRVAANFKAY